jgi:hypothetical protein
MPIKPLELRERENYRTKYKPSNSKRPVDGILNERIK